MHDLIYVVPKHAIKIDKNLHYSWSCVSYLPAPIYPMLSDGTLPTSMHKDDYITIFSYRKGVHKVMFVFPPQCYIIHTTASSVMPWIIKCILMRNAGQLLSEYIQTAHQFRYNIGVNA